jgi:hypothetical protein
MRQNNARKCSFVAPSDSNDSNPLFSPFARKNFFADSFLGLRIAKVQEFPRVAVFCWRNTPRFYAILDAFILINPLAHFEALIHYLVVSCLGSHTRLGI